jgi:hypothetical protein
VNEIKDIVTVGGTYVWPMFEGLAPEDVGTPQATRVGDPKQLESLLNVNIRSSRHKIGVYQGVECYFPERGEDSCKGEVAFTRFLEAGWSG